jgi:UDP-glucose 4-epimerase
VKRKVLVTGGAGFIGSHIADAYLARGDQVWVLDNLSSGKRENIPAAAEFVEGGIETPVVGELFERVGGFDIVNHHAAQIDVRKSVADPQYDARLNILGVLNVLEACVKHETKRVVFVSSGGVVYGEPEQRPTPETAPKQPLSPYGVSKLTAEYYLFYYHRIQGLDYVAVRYSNVYGPRQDPHGEAGVVAIFSSRIRNGEPLTIFGDGAQTRDYVFVHDVVRANMLLSDATIARGNTIDERAFNVGTGIETSVNELASTLMKVAGREVRCVHAPERRGELRFSSLLTGRLNALGWEPRSSLSEGLAQTYRWLEEKEKSR